MFLCRLSLVVASRVYFPVVGRGLLIVVASLVAEHRLSGTWASVAAAPGSRRAFGKCLNIPGTVSSPQSCPTLCDPIECSPPGSSVHGISQARILERIANSFSQSLLMVELCGGNWAGNLPPGPKIKAKLKTPVNSPTGTRDSLSDISYPHPVPQRSPLP